MCPTVDIGQPVSETPHVPETEVEPKVSYEISKVHQHPEHKSEDDGIFALAVPGTTCISGCVD